MKKPYLYSICLATSLSPLVLLVGSYGFGSTKYLSPATLFLLYGGGLLLIVGIIAIVALITVAVRHFGFNRTSRNERVLAGVAGVFLLAFWIASSFSTAAFVGGARARIDALGGPEFVVKLRAEAETLGRDADPAWRGVIPEDRIPQIFREIGAKNITLMPDLGVVHVGVSGAFFPSGWWLVEDDSGFQPSADYHRVYPHLYRFKK